MWRAIRLLIITQTTTVAIQFRLTQQHPAWNQELPVPVRSCDCRQSTSYSMNNDHSRTDHPPPSLPSSYTIRDEHRNVVDHHTLKKRKSYDEDPSTYSQNVRKKQAGINRTGQACDRCKERKMKCDSNKFACKPARTRTSRVFRLTG